MPAAQHQQRQAQAAERMRRTRERRRDGMRHVGVDIHDSEVAELVRRGLLPHEDQDYPPAIAHALGLLLDETL